ncbi:hypothetical protein BGZ70_008604 [Mortierella alpina]|uniref:Single-stranded DNA-binding protein n=1 Tax=Mortierella alpina TaxID=64518 RepID=A0A9P6J389_MORAP|nr:hypothetical protein BGZ70_008604 [Mortierella alpina]
MLSPIRLTSYAKRITAPTLGAVRTYVNSAMIIGHVGQDAEFKEFKDRTVVNFTMATNENRKDAEGNWVKTTHWHNVVSWDQSKNRYLIESLKKGDTVMVEGPIQYRTFTAKDGSDKHRTEILLKKFQVVARKQPRDV